MDILPFLQNIEMPSVEILLSLLLGIGLSASCGFRVFLPPLVMSVAAQFFGIALPQELGWLNTQAAFYIFLTASIIEVIAYYVPWLDNLLDTISTPAAVVAGTIITSSFLSNDLDPILKWSLGLVAGGGIAGGIQGLTTTSRLASTTLTAGLTNPLIATAENFLAALIPILSILFPIVAVILGTILLFCAIGILFTIYRLNLRRKAC